jgi:hypothetical protein
MQGKSEETLQTANCLCDLPVKTHRPALPPSHRAGPGKRCSTQQRCSRTPLLQIAFCNCHFAIVIAWLAILPASTPLLPTRARYSGRKGRPDFANLQITHEPDSASGN